MFTIIVIISLVNLNECPPTCLHSLPSWEGCSSVNPFVYCYINLNHLAPIPQLSSLVLIPLCKLVWEWGYDYTSNIITSSSFPGWKLGCSQLKRSRSWVYILCAGRLAQCVKRHKLHRRDAVYRWVSSCYFCIVAEVVLLFLILLLLLLLLVVLLLLLFLAC